MRRKTVASRRSFLTAAAGFGVLERAVFAQSRSSQKWVYVVDDFSAPTSGWLPGFADYSLSTSPTNRVAGIRRVPSEIESQTWGYYLQGRNTSDDLFMFLKKPVTARDGLVRDQNYSVSFRIEFASEARSGCVGIGGAPGESVTLKAGASTVEPLPVLDGNMVRLNIDKGNQSTGGADASIVSDIANGIPCESDVARRWVLLERIHQHPRPVRTDSSGTLWLFLGTDSGFEGTTALYYCTIVALLTLQEGG